MSRTLFWYILKDLLRIFFLANGVLSGIMSFGGVLRPLTEHGLNIGQVLKMLSYFSPAMTAYSLPIAALFATTMVYGRLSADNEITACRAVGISHLALAIPAIVLGLTVAIFSLLLLCFIVPAFMLKAERVVFSNVAQLVANEIERTHQIKLERGTEPITVFAETAQVMPTDPEHPHEQVVVMKGPMFIMYESQSDKTAASVPSEFFIAKSATSYISQNEESDELQFMTVLDMGREFPRVPKGSEGGVDRGTFAAKYPSMVRENTKFMDVWRLKELLNDESKSKRVNDVLVDFVEAEQKERFLTSIREQLTSETSEARIFVKDTTDIYYISRGKGISEWSSEKKDKLRIGATAAQFQHPVHVRQEHDGQLVRRFEAQQIEIEPSPDNQEDSQESVIHTTIVLRDCIERIGESEAIQTSFSIDFDAMMSDTLRSLPKQRNAAYYAHNNKINPGEQKKLARARMIITNTVQSELHSRVSFALSCLILVMVGCALGMMFRSGNFLSAFALSVIPALICIALIITGQHTCDNVPWDVTHFHNSLTLGLSLIWSGNVAVAIIAMVLLGRLQQQ